MNRDEANLISNSENFELPKVILGTSSLGNLYDTLPYFQKLEIVKAGIENSDGLTMFDTAGKYGAGLALEILGKCLKELGVPKEKVIISNKLGWLRKPLESEEPTFEKGIWKDLKFDAYQNISYEGILACFEQGNQLLGGYIPQLLSVHDPDEYLEAAENENDRNKRLEDIKGAYRALFELKAKGKVDAIGIGAKNWQVIEELEKEVELDWIMFANSMTLYDHPKKLINFIKRLKVKGTTVINSAVFNSGFLTGNDYFNYQLVNRKKNIALFNWRDGFFKLCRQFEVEPAAACVYFSLNIPGISSVALNSSSPTKTAKNFQLAEKEIPSQFWDEMKKMKLIRKDYPFL